MYLLLPTLLSLLISTISSSFTLSLTDQGINKQSDYTLTITRSSPIPATSLTLSFPPSPSGINTLSSQYLFNSTTSTYPPTNIISFPSTTQTTFTITITNVINPSYALTLNSTNVQCIIASQTIQLSDTVVFEKGALEYCSILFTPTVRVVGSSNVSIRTANGLGNNSVVQVVFPLVNYSSTRGPTIDNSLLNNVLVTKVSLTYPNATTQSPTFTFTYTSNSINITINTPLPSSTAITISISNINTPPYETISFIMQTTTLSPYGAVDTYQNCHIQNTSIPTIYGNFSSTGPINSFISSPTSTSINFQNIKIVVGDKFITELSFNGSTFNDSNVSLYNSNETIDCTRGGICIISNSGAESLPHQSYMIRFSRSLKLPASAEGAYVNITFSSSSNSRYLRVSLYLKPNPGTLTNIHLTTSPTTIGAASNATFTLNTSTNPLPTQFGIYIKSPTGTAFLSNSSCSTTMSQLTSPHTHYINPQSIVCEFTTSSNISNKQINFRIDGFQNGLTTNSYGPFLVHTLLNASNIQSVVDTDNGYYYSGFTQGVIGEASVSCSNDSVGSKSQCTFVYKNIVNLTSSTRVTIKSPSAVSISSTSVIVTIAAIPYNIIGTISGQNITLSLPTSVQKNSQISIKIQVTNPSITGTTQSFSIYDSTSTGSPISKIEDTLNISITTPQWISFNVYPAVSMTGASTTYTLSFRPLTLHPANSYVIVTFQTITLEECTSNCSCAFVNVSAINITFPHPLAIGQTYTCSLNNVLNPRTVKLQSAHLQSLFEGSGISQGVTNIKMNLPSVIYLSDPSTNKQYNQIAPITLFLDPYNILGITDYLIVNLDTVFYSESGATIQCTPSTDYSCLTLATTTTLNIRINFITSPQSQFTLHLNGYQTGNIGLTGNIVVKSYDSSNNQIDQSNNFPFAPTCLSGCRTCDSVNTSSCLSCYPSGTYAIYLIENVCTNNCSTINQFYYNAGGVCQSCNTNCTSCTTETICTSCRTNFFLFSNGSCLETCPSEYYHTSGTLVGNFGNIPLLMCFACSSPCKQCQSSSTNCLSCLNQSLVIFANQCVETCPDGSYLNNKICSLCDQSCKICTGPSSYNCSVCSNTFVNTTIGRCLSTCPSGTVYNSLISVCQCSEGCLQCSNSIYNCSRCQTNYYFYNNSCYRSCPAGLNPFGTTCIACFPGCKQCTSITTCTKCQTNYLYNGNCYSDCKVIGDNFINNDVSMVCTQCGTGCLNCSSGNSSLCLSCSVGYSLLDGKCVVNNQTTGGCGSGQKLLNGVCSKTNTTEIVISSVSIGSVGLVSTSVVIISKILGSTTSIPFSAMALIAPQEQITWIVKVVLGYTTGSTSTSSRRLLLLLDNNTIDLATLLLIVAIGSTYILNGVHIWLFCQYIQSDPQFSKNKRRQCARITDTVILLIATLTSYKFYQIVFSKLCNVTIFKTQLSSVSRLLPLKILNAFSLIVSLAAIAGAAISMTRTSNELQYVFAIMSIVLSIMSIIWTLLSFIRDDNFFGEQNTIYSEEDSVVKNIKYVETGMIEMEGEDKGRSQLKRRRRVAPIEITQQNILDQVDERDSPLEKKSKLFGNLSLGTLNESMNQIKPSVLFNQIQEQEIKSGSSQNNNLNFHPMYQNKIQTKKSDAQQLPPSTFMKPSLQKVTPSQSRQLKPVKKDKDFRKSKALEVINFDNQIDDSAILDLNEAIPDNQQQPTKLNKSNRISSEIKIRSNKDRVLNLQRNSKRVEPIKFSEEISEISKGKEEKPLNLFSEESDNSKLFSIKKGTTNEFNIESRFFTSAEFGEIEQDFDYNEVSPSSYNFKNQRFSGEEFQQRTELFSLKSFEMKDLTRE